MSKQKAIRRSPKPFESVEQVRTAEQPRTELMSFCPPKDNKIAKFCARFIVPRRLKKRFGVTAVKVVGTHVKLAGADEKLIGLEYLKSLEGQRCILPFNHPSRKDPEVAFTVGLMAGEYFNYLAAREVFDEHNGLMGKIMQWLGCYSVVRGTADRESFKTTQRLLVENLQKLVIYREGEINSRNDDPLDCEPGVIRLAIWALQQLESEGRLAPIYLPKVGTKFRYLYDIEAMLDACLIRLEAHLAITAEGGLYKRLRQVCIRTLADLQDEYGLKHDPDESTLNDQVKVLRRTIVQKAANLLEIELPDVSTLDCVRVIRNEIDERVFKSEEGMSPYRRKLDRQSAESLCHVYSMIRTVQLFIAASDGYVKETMTQERFAEVIDMLELEHFGAATVKGETIAFVYIGEGINLLDYWEEYKTNKKGRKDLLQKLADEVSKGGREAIRLADQASSYIPHRTIR